MGRWVPISAGSALAYDPELWIAEIDYVASVGSEQATVAGLRHSAAGVTLFASWAPVIEGVACDRRRGVVAAAKLRLRGGGEGREAGADRVPTLAGEDLVRRLSPLANRLRHVGDGDGSAFGGEAAGDGAADAA